MHAKRASAERMLMRVQEIDCFRTVGTAVAGYILGNSQTRISMKSHTKLTILQEPKLIVVHGSNDLGKR